MRGALVVIFLLNYFGHLTVNGLALMPVDSEGTILGEILDLAPKLHKQKSLLEVRQLIDQLLANHPHANNLVADSMKSNLNVATRFNSANSFDSAGRRLGTPVDSTVPQVINIPDATNGNGSPLSSMSPMTTAAMPSITSQSSNAISLLNTVLPDGTDPDDSTNGKPGSSRRRRKRRRAVEQANPATAVPVSTINTSPVSGMLATSTPGQTQTIQNDIINSGSSTIGPQHLLSGLGSSIDSTNSRSTRQVYRSDLPDQHPDMMHPDSHYHQLRDHNGLPLGQTPLPLGQLSLANGVVDRDEQFEQYDAQHHLHNGHSGGGQLLTTSGSSPNLLQNGVGQPLSNTQRADGSEAMQSLVDHDGIHRQHSHAGYTGTDSNGMAHQFATHPQNAGQTYDGTPTNYDSSRYAHPITQSSRLVQTQTGTYTTGTYSPATSYPQTTIAPQTTGYQQTNPYPQANGYGTNYTPGDSISRSSSPALDSKGNTVYYPAGQVGQPTARNTQFNTVAQSVPVQSSLPLTPTANNLNQQSLAMDRTVTNTPVPIVNNLPPVTATVQQTTVVQPYQPQPYQVRTIVGGQTTHHPSGTFGSLQR